MPEDGRRAAAFLSRLSILLASLILLLAGGAPAQNDNSRCLRCHGEEWIATRRPESLAAMVRAPTDGERVLRAAEDIPLLYTPEDAFNSSAHGGISCEECHPGIETLPHYQNVESLSCRSCHEAAANEMDEGLHSAEIAGTPDCTDCHGGVHEMRTMEAGPSYVQALEMVERCSECHNETVAGGFSPAKSFHDSIHGEALYQKGLIAAPLCTDCHGTHKMLSPSDPESPMAPANAPETCGTCHEGVTDIYLTSIHGQNLQAGMEGAASCISCHHSHGIEQVGPEFLREVVHECSNCHIELGKSYLRSYHGKVTELGGKKVAVCSSCHGAHDILPPQNPASRVSKENLIETCGECHPRANENFVQYIAHVDYTSPKEHPAVFYSFWGMTLLLCSVLAIFIPHTLLWFQRSLIDHVKGLNHKPKSKRMVRRFSPIHRVTHGLIVISFMGLVATGFPLKYSYTEWAHNLSNAFGGIMMMGFLHRVFAVITFAYAGVHVGFLIYFFWKKCPAPRWRYLIGPDSLVFRWKDVKDFIAMVRWFFRAGPRPRFDRWAYFEKFDYWGEIWGVLIIGGTGLMLWFPTLFSRWLPGWALNVAMVIHSIEALLAASVIFLVHFFNTHLRLEKFPVDTVMWSGHMPEDEMREERPEEYERLVKSGELESRIEEPMALRWRILGTVLGISAFLFGIALILLAIGTEIFNITH